jgi:hypothetical protein
MMLEEASDDVIHDVEMDQRESKEAAEAVSTTWPMPGDAMPSRQG